MAAYIVISSCKSTIPRGSQRYAYQVSWHILNQIKKLPGPISNQDIDTILESISDNKCRIWALDWRNQKKIYLTQFQDLDAVVLNPKAKSIKTGKPIFFVMQKHYESPKSVDAKEIVNLPR